MQYIRISETQWCGIDLIFDSDRYSWWIYDTTEKPFAASKHTFDDPQSAAHEFIRVKYGIDIDPCEFVRAFNDCYESFYNSRDDHPRYADALNAGDYLIQKHHWIVGYANICRNDLVVSDRETAALALTAEHFNIR